jgi:hypothetical protein
MLGFDALGRLALGQVPSGGGAAIFPGSWYVNLSEPIVKQNIRLGTANQPFLFFHPNPVVSFGWFESLIDPVKVPLRLRTGLNQDFILNPLPRVSFGWFGELSKPQKLFLTWLPTADQQTFTTDPTLFPNPARFLEGWFNWYSEPVRFKLGLSVTLQQTLAYHPRILPKPNITATMSAFEGVDVFLGAINVIQSNPAASAKVSIREISVGNSATSVRER